MMASGHGHVEVVQALLAAGADKEAKGEVGGGVCRKRDSVRATLVILLPMTLCAMALCLS